MTHGASRASGTREYGQRDCGENDSAITRSAEVVDEEPPGGLGGGLARVEASSSEARSGAAAAGGQRGVLQGGIGGVASFVMLMSARAVRGLVHGGPWRIRGLPSSSPRTVPTVQWPAEPASGHTARSGAVLTAASGFDGDGSAFPGTVQCRGVQRSARCGVGVGRRCGRSVSVQRGRGNWKLPSPRPKAPDPNSAAGRHPL